MTPLLQPTSGAPVPQYNATQPHGDVDHGGDAFKVVLHSAKSQDLPEKDPEAPNDNEVEQLPDDAPTDEPVLDPSIIPLPSVDVINTESAKRDPSVASPTPSSERMTPSTKSIEVSSNEMSRASFRPNQASQDQAANLSQPLKTLLLPEGSEGRDVILPKNTPSDGTASVTAKSSSVDQAPPAAQLAEIPRTAAHATPMISPNVPSSSSGRAGAIGLPASTTESVKLLPGNPEMQAAVTKPPAEIAKIEQPLPPAKSAPLNLFQATPREAATVAASDTPTMRDVLNLSESVTVQRPTKTETQYRPADSKKSPPPVATPLAWQTAQEKPVINMLDSSDPFIRFDPVGPVGDKLSSAWPVSPIGSPAPADQARMIAQQLANGMPTKAPGTTEITLNPEELGRVRMNLSINDGAMQLTIHADRPETMDLMRRHIDQLAQTYRQLGFENTTFNFAGSSHDNTDQQGPATQAHDTSIAIPTQETTVVSALPHVDGRLDLRM